MNAVERAALQRGLALLRDGDRSAFDGVFSALWPLFEGMARHQLQADADDVAQEALLKLFGRIGEFDPQRDALSWCLGIMAFELRTARKRRLRRREDAETSLASSPGTSPTPEDEAITRDLCAAANEILGDLRPGDAEILGRAARGEREPTPTFRKRLERAVARLRLAWSATHGID